MEAVLSPTLVAARGTVTDWPPHVQMILSSLEAAQRPQTDRRALRRAPYRSKAHLRLFTHASGAAPVLLYTRDACTRGIGFVTPHYLPLGYGGKLELLMPSGRVAIAQCTLCRCRQISPGWYEGALNFSREQQEFASLLE